MATFTVSILTVSDRCSQGEAVDKTGPALAEWCTHNGLNLLNRKVVPDNISEIQESVIEFCETCDLVLTTGGTGFGVRDLTPEAIEPLLNKKASGLTVAMLYGSLSKTPMAALSRPVCGVRLGQHQNTLVVTLPGSVKGAIENIENIKMVLNHALELVRGGTEAGEEKHAEMYLANNSCHCSGRPFLNQTESVEDFKSVSHGGKLANRFRESPFKMVEFQTALDFVQVHSLRLESIEVSVDSHIAGYVIAEDIIAQEPGMKFLLVPSYRASVVDGYAVVASDGPGIFPVAGFAAAGSKLPPELHSGQIIRVSTGAPLPAGSTAVVMVEDTKLLESLADESEECSVEILASAKETQFVREIGSDIKRGEIVLRKGHVVSGHGGEIGVFAMLGISKIKVYRKPIVGVMSTGNELLVENSLIRKVGQIRDCNRPALIAAIKTAGYTAIDFGIASDSEEALMNKLNNALPLVDVIVTTGGVSMGEHDYLKPVLEGKLGATIHFGRVHVKPGKPATFATIPFADKKKLIFALPGNPVSALVMFNLLTIYSLKLLSGNDEKRPKYVLAILDHDIKLDSRPEFQRAQVELRNHEWHALTTGIQSSSRILSLAHANAIIELPAATEDRCLLRKGSKVNVQFF